MTRPYESPRDKITLEVERILMVDLATTRAHAKGVVPTIIHEGGQRPAFTRASQNMAAAAMLLDMLPQPSADGVDRCNTLFSQKNKTLEINYLIY
jgi:hypothetical protein